MPPAFSSARNQVRVDTIQTKHYLAEQEDPSATQTACALVTNCTRRWTVRPEFLTSLRNCPMSNCTPPSALPEEFTQRLRQIVSTERFADCWSSFKHPMATAFRINSLGGQAEDVAAELTNAGLELQPLTWKADAFTVPNDQRRALTESTACAEGRIYIPVSYTHLTLPTRS